MTHSKLSVLVVAIGLLAAVGCSDEAATPPPQTGQPAAGAANPAEAAPAAAPGANDSSNQEYARPEYPNSNRRNPFQPDPDVVQPQGTVDNGEVRQLDPLEQFGVGELELVAIISEVAIPKAMFLDPDGFGHVIKEGDRIGRNGAIVTDIRDNEVEMTETPDPEEGGQATTRLVRLSDRQIASGDEGLSEEDREALKRLLQSEEGVRALRQTVQGGGSQGTAPPQNTTTTQDPRFRGSAPPTQGEQ